MQNAQKAAPTKKYMSELKDIVRTLIASITSQQIVLWNLKMQVGHVAKSVS